MPDADASASLVRHILYSDGVGRSTPYLSTTELPEVADYFAGLGKVWRTEVGLALALGVRHRSRTELVDLLQGAGKGDAGGHSAFEVMMARQYVQQWQEHLLDFRSWANSAPQDPAGALAQMCNAARP